MADAARFAEHFGARRYIHREELAAQPDAEVVLDGGEPLELASGVIAIPTPGHTAGHCCLLMDDRYLFSGDHLYWDRKAEHLAAFPDHCWHSWPMQVESMLRLSRFDFEWVLPGHGQRVSLPREEMRVQLVRLIEVM